MVDVKSVTNQGTNSLFPARVDPNARVVARSAVQVPEKLTTMERQGAGQIPDRQAGSVYADFAAPSARTNAWLADPRLTAALEAASQTLAPNGATPDPVDRYAASVIETHLAARRRVSQQTNALLKT